MQDPSGEISINLYVPFRLSDPAAGVDLELTASGPGAFDLFVRRDSDATLRLRWPEYVRDMRVSAGGYERRVQRDETGTVALRAPWIAGDIVHIEFDYAFTATPCPTDPAKFGLRFGPWHLAALRKGDSALAFEPEDVAAAFEGADPAGPWVFGGHEFVPLALVGGRPSYVYFPSARMAAQVAEEARYGAPTRDLSAVPSDPAAPAVEETRAIEPVANLTETEVFHTPETPDVERIFTELTGPLGVIEPEDLPPDEGRFDDTLELFERVPAR